MRSMVDVKHLVDEDYSRKKNHFRHADGAPPAAGRIEAEEHFAESMQAINNRLVWCACMDQAWIVCLHQAGVISTASAKRVLTGLAELLKNEKTGWGGEPALIRQLDGDEDTASLINLGRTLQEPMSRLQMRTKLIEIFDDILKLLQTIIAVADRNIDTIMPGHTHLSQGQPITLAHYLLSIFDGIHRGLRHLELAYHETNQNSGGCGACSGTTWPVDRRELACLLGMDGVVEPTYDCEAAQDHSMSILFALSNIALLISKSSMDGNIWGMEEVDMLHNDPAWCGMSSFMPHKCNTGSQFERSRIQACDVLAEMMRGVALNKGEPHADMLPMMQVPKAALRAMAHAQLAIRYYRGLLEAVVPQRRQMLQYAREGFSCATEVAVYMIRELGYGGRRAHRIAATFVRMARMKGLCAYETTGELLDDAARFVDEKPPHINTAELRRLLDPEVFIASHTYIGGTAPAETRRMIDIRRELITEARQRLRERKDRIQAGSRRLEEAIAAIIDEQQG